MHISARQSSVRVELFPQTVEETEALNDSFITGVDTLVFGLILSRSDCQAPESE